MSRKIYCLCLLVILFFSNSAWAMQWRVSSDAVIGDWNGLTTCKRAGKHTVTFSIHEQTPILKDGWLEYEAELKVRSSRSGELNTSPTKFFMNAAGMSSLGRRSASETYFMIIKRDGGLLLKLRTHQQCSLLMLKKFHRIGSLHNASDICFYTTIWIERAARRVELSRKLKKQYPQLLSSYEPKDSFYYSLFNKNEFKSLIGANFLALSDEDIAAVIDYIDMCNGFGKRGRDTKYVLPDWYSRGDITVNDAKNWHSMLLHAEEVINTISSEAKSLQDLPENVEKLESLITLFLGETAGIPVSSNHEIFKAHLERLRALIDMVRLVEENGWEMLPPKQPLNAKRSGDVTPDDETLPSVSAEKIDEQRKPVDVNIE